MIFSDNKLKHSPGACWDVFSAREFMIFTGPHVVDKLAQWVAQIPYMSKVVRSTPPVGWISFSFGPRSNSNNLSQLHLHSQNTCCTHTIDSLIFTTVYTYATHIFTHTNIILYWCADLDCEQLRVVSVYSLWMICVVRKLPLLQLPFLRFSNKASSKVWIICLNNPILLESPTPRHHSRIKTLRLRKCFCLLTNRTQDPT